jgi:hypothetical protein
MSTKNQFCAQSDQASVRWPLPSYMSSCDIYCRPLLWRRHFAFLSKLSYHSLTVFQDKLLSRPLLRLMYGEYWFRLSRLSMMVIGSFASYTETKLVESAVWCLLTLDDDVEQVAGTAGTSSALRVTWTGSKYLNTVQDQNCSFLFFEQQNKHWWTWNKANNRTMNKINERLKTNNEQQRIGITGTDIYTIK